MGSKETSPTNPDCRNNGWDHLPFDYRNLKVSVGSRPIGFRFSQSIFNIEADFNDVHIITCGEASSPDLAITKAIAELIERTAMIEWSRTQARNFRMTSNGWAAHQTFANTRLNAICERIERDAVLAHWYSTTPFLQMSKGDLPDQLRSWVSAELAQSELPLLTILLSTIGIGPSITCLLTNESGYGVSGHACKANLLESIESAISEACRAAHHVLRRSFWKDSLLLKHGDVTQRVRPGAHAVYYAYHEPFPRWMFGTEVSWSEANGYWVNRIEEFHSNALKDFSFQAVLSEPMYVGFATHPECFEIAWGPTDTSLVLAMAANRRFAVPLTERTLNRQPHIIS